MDDQAREWIEQGRARCGEREWARAADLLRSAGQRAALGGEDLERLALCVYMQADEDAAIQLLDRAHRAYMTEGEPAKAIRCAFWSGLTLMFQGKEGQGSGWFSRAHRLLQELGEACVESGYLLLPDVERHLMRGDDDQAFARATEAADVGQRFEDADLVCMARHLQGTVRLLQERVDEGLALLDEAMVSVAADRVSPRVTGLIYCSVIKSCLMVCAFERAREWTAALSTWCDAQPSLLNFTGKCLIHRAEIMRINGSWAEALEEAERAVERFLSDSPNRATALYERAEILRLMGNLDEAENVYALVGSFGGDPQPGLGLLRSAQGKKEQARASIHRALSAAKGVRRAILLAAAVEIEASVDVPSARAHCQDLIELSRRYGTTALLADAALAQGRVELAEKDFALALRSLRTAQDLYERLGMPYHVGQVRLGMAEACRGMGDEDGHSMELRAAEAMLKALRAGLSPPESAAPSGGGPLSRKETEVLRHVSRGETNKKIAAKLFLSVRTVDRHLSNIFNKLGVSSRAEATAHAIHNGLI
jgi:DNA-binding CsgD family transcriptional regulator